MSSAVAAIFAVSAAFVSSPSTFESIGQDQAAKVTGGACYNIVAAGCQTVINIKPDGTIIVNGGAGCNSLEGNKITTAGGTWSTRATGKWCSFWHTWSCGFVQNSRGECSGGPGGGGPIGNPIPL